MGGRAGQGHPVGAATLRTHQGQGAQHQRDAHGQPQREVACFGNHGCLSAGVGVAVCCTSDWSSRLCPFCARFSASAASGGM